MIAIDRKRYDRAALEHFHNLLGEQQELRIPSGRLVALCLDDPFELIGAVLYLRKRGGSALLLPQQTPLESAVRLAEQAGSSALLFGRYSNARRLNGTTGSESAEPLGPGLLQFSSGTTGAPKLIRRPWSEIEAEITAYLAKLAAPREEQPIIWVPVSHSYGLICGVLASLARGAEPIVVTDRNPRLWNKLLIEHPQSLVYAVPFLLHLFLSFKLPARFHRVVSSGSPLTDELLVQLQAVSHEVIQQYGCSELGCVSLARNPCSADDVGEPLPHMRILQAGGGDQWAEWVFANGRIETATRDIGYLDEQGRLRLLGRMDDLINVGGQKVIPLEVEQVLHEHPAVQEAVVFRTRHQVWGEAVRAWVVPQGDADEDQLRQWCIERLPPYKVPGRIELVEAIPRNPNGKVVRKQLEQVDFD